MPGAAMMPASDRMRLLVCLGVSCLLHAALLLMPYLGMSANAPRPAVQGGQQLPRTLYATLVLEKESAFAAAELSTESAGGESVTVASAGRTAGEGPRPEPVHAEGAGLLPIPAPTYYTPDQLTKRPRPIAEPRLNVPEIGTIDASGTVILKLWISYAGEVTSVKVEKTDLPGVFPQTAVAAFMGLRFTPGERNGQRVDTVMTIEFRYDNGRISPP